MDSSQSALYSARLPIRAFLEKSLEGLKTRFSTRWEEDFLELMGAIWVDL
jgi:hypothetical protein